MEVSINWGSYFGGLYMEDSIILGPYWVALILGNSQIFQTPEVRVFLESGPRGSNQPTVCPIHILQVPKQVFSVQLEP